MSLSPGSFTHFVTPAEPFITQRGGSTQSHTVIRCISLSVGIHLEDSHCEGKINSISMTDMRLSLPFIAFINTRHTLTILHLLPCHAHYPLTSEVTVESLSRYGSSGGTKRSQPL